MSDFTTAFDRRLDIMGKQLGLGHLVDGAAYVHDTLELAKMAADDIFGKNAPADVVLGIYDRIRAEHLRREAEEEKERSQYDK